MVLAAGAGRRLASLTGGVPKQFWRLNGGPTLLEATLSRLRPLAPPDGRLSSWTGRMSLTCSPPAGIRGAGRFIQQPADRGTAAGVLLGLLPVLTRDPDALVVLTPSDQGVRETGVFRAGIRQAASLTAATATW